MDYRIKIIIFILLVIIEISLDKNINKCKNILGKLLLIGHHFGGVYLVLGSLLLGYHLFHLIIIVLTIIPYIIYNGCFLTVWNNILCNFDEKALFTSWLNILFGDKNIKTIHIIGISIVILYDLYYINKEYKFINL